MSATGTDYIAAPLVVHGFLDHAACVSCCDVMRDSVTDAATIVDSAGRSVVAAAIRRTASVRIPAAVYETLRGRLETLQPRLADHFGLSLDGVQQPEFLLYRRGDFFRPHQDNSVLEQHGLQLRNREVSAVLFLNRQSRLPAEGTYCGGALRLYTAASRGRPVPYVEIAGESGLLVAFHSSVLHEVRTVSHGERFTIAVWYTGRPPAEKVCAPLE
jgi:predicted 2-oxoglutarate/Fe(II)-dependent dioxygenase YbiX